MLRPAASPARTRHIRPGCAAAAPARADRSVSGGAPDWPADPPAHRRSPREGQSATRSRRSARRSPPCCRYSAFRSLLPLQDHRVLLPPCSVNQRLRTVLRSGRPPLSRATIAKRWPRSSALCDFRGVFVAAWPLTMQHVDPQASDSIWPTELSRGLLRRAMRLEPNSQRER